MPDFDGLTESLHDFDFHFDFDTDAWKDKVGDWQEHLEESLGEAREAHQHAMGELHELLEAWKTDGGSKELDLGGLRGLFGGGKGLHGAPRIRAFGHMGKPKHNFEVREDGTIEVMIRRGDSELVQLFEDEDDLARRKPKLFEKYERLMSAEDDE